MSSPIEKLQQAMNYAMKNRPAVGGFPFLAEVLRQAGVAKNTWSLPSCQSVYVMKAGSVVNQGSPLVQNFANVAVFDREALIRALRTDQEGKSTFPEFLMSAWKAGVVGYEVNFEKRFVHYYGVNGESYVEEYPAIEIKSFLQV